MLFPALILISIIFICFLFWQLSEIRSFLKKLQDSIKARQSFLVEDTHSVIYASRQKQVIQSMNSLIDENNRLRHTNVSRIEQMEQILEAMQEAFILINENNLIVLANPAAEKLANQTAQLRGQYIESLFRSARLFDIIKTIQSGKPISSEATEVIINEKKLWIEVSGAPLYYSEDSSKQQQTLSLFLLHDITRLKHLESMHKAFVANVSHELRTPLTLIKGFSDLLVDDHKTMDTTSQERFLKKIQFHVQRLTQMIADLMTLTQLDSTIEPAQRSLKPIGLFMNEMLPDLRERLKIQSKSLTFDIEPEAENFHVNALRLHQIFDNLFDNIVLHAKGFQNVWLSIRSTPKEIIFIVEDDGCGIPETDLPHIFDRFYRVDKSRSRDKGGTGLGLSIVKQLVETEGGTIEVGNRDPQGVFTQFTLAHLSI